MVWCGVVPTVWLPPERGFHFLRNPVTATTDGRIAHSEGWKRGEPCSGGIRTVERPNETQPARSGRQMGDTEQAGALGEKRLAGFPDVERGRLASRMTPGRKEMQP